MDKLKALAEERLKKTMPMLYKDILDEKVKFYTRQGPMTMPVECEKTIKRLKEEENQDVVGVVYDERLGWFTYLVITPYDYEMPDRGLVGEDMGKYIRMYAYVEGNYNEYGSVGVIEKDNTILRLY